ncbi:helix-turn-helix transcriptional regulator [Catellatospora sp. KI3]|uniref:helix-turn-helix domain-containing protein n=1 Tax=Catellatospora sp. KI3 TaxID=3041620 RepID=UPI002482B064|nr:helix-turn-helix transcriptional regulator [Catellatospora sp. KI3]MDI1464740.1 helix-turn-helix transcriptional regulator [Catellatospora sp. KI3]
MAADPEAGASGGPTVLRMLLGAQLRRLREAGGITREDAGWHIRASESKISRMELGRVGFKERDVADLLTFYGVTDTTERETMMALARQANEAGWWQQFGDVYPAWFQSYLGLESAAQIIRMYEVQFVPGLLQTADYARSVIMLGHAGKPTAEVDRRVELRMTRQQILTRSRPAPPHFWAVVDEGALRRPVGGRAVMRAQIAKLLEATKLPNVTLQVIPFAHGGHAAYSGSFALLRFPEHDLPDVAYMEQLTSALYLDKREDVERYLTVMEQLCVDAAPPAHTPRILEGIARDLDRD